LLFIHRGTHTVHFYQANGSKNDLKGIYLTTISHWSVVGTKQITMTTRLTD